MAIFIEAYVEVFIPARSAVMAHSTTQIVL